jgi:glutamyl-tRNA synthetase
MTYKDLADYIFPNVNETIEDLYQKYPNRNLEEGACVTRFAPSPTGFVHIGNFFAALIDYVIAKNTNGIFYLRNEDTDQLREVDGAMKKIMETLNTYKMTPDEYEFEGKTIGNYGPYIQSERKHIYHVFIKHLIEIGRAYPCFATKEELEELRASQEHANARTGYYGRYARYRNITPEEAIRRIEEGQSYVIRFKSSGNFEEKFKFIDEVRGLLFLSENDEDFVIMKSDNGLPTYHLAHAVDDALMHTTHVVRGEEWLSSVPKHVELFEAINAPLPKYIHIPLILKQEGSIKRKISKRKDPEASMSYYEEMGYPTLAVIESLMTIANSNYEEWHTQNPDKSFMDFPFNPKKMSASGGALYDMEKLNNISKDMISKMTKEELAKDSYNWACKYSNKLKELIENDYTYYENILNIEREQAKPRKDITYYSDILNQIWYMYDTLFEENKEEYEFMKINDLEEIKSICNLYINNYYDETDDKDTWFNKIKEMCDTLGYASNMKEYKQNPDMFKGNVADISTVLRVALTKKAQTPDLYEIMKLLTSKRMKERIQKLS